MYKVCLCCPETVDIQDILLPSLGNEKLITFLCQQELCSGSPRPPGWKMFASHCRGICFLSGIWGAVRRGRNRSLGWGPGHKGASCKGCGPFLLRCCWVRPMRLPGNPWLSFSPQHLTVHSAQSISLFLWYRILLVPFVAKHPACTRAFCFSFWLCVRLAVPTQEEQPSLREKHSILDLGGTSAYPALPTFIFMKTELREASDVSMAAQ